MKTKEIIFYTFKTLETLTKKQLQQIGRDNKIILGRKRSKLSMRKILFPYFSARKIKTNPFAKNQSLVFFKTETLKNMSSYPFLVVL